MATFTLPVSKNIWSFDPTSIGGCVLWLDAADTNTVFSNTAGTTPATNGSVVGQWKDKSISVNHATRITSSTTYPISGATYSIDSVSGRNFLNFGYANVSLTGYSGGFFNVTSDKSLSIGQSFYVYGTLIAGTYTLSITANTTYYIVGVGGTLPNLTLSLSGTVGGPAITPSGTLSSVVPAMIDGGAFTLVAGSRLPTGQANGTYFFVSSLSSGSLAPSINNQVFNYGNWGGAQARQFTISPNNYAIGTVNNSASNNSVVGSYTNKVYTTVFDSYKVKSWVNGSEGSGGVADLTTLTPPFNTGTNGIPYIGCFMGSGPYTNASYGTISEILVYNSTLSNTDRQIVEGYLAWKWQLQSALPSTHPYNNNAITPQFTPNDFGATLWLDAADTSSITPTPINGSAISIWRDKASSVASFVPVSSSPTFDTSTGYNAVLITNTISGTSYVMTSAATGTGTFTGNITIAGTVYTATITAGSTTLTTSTATIIEQLSVVTAGTYGTVIIGADVKLNGLTPVGTVSVQQTLRSSTSIQYMNTSSTVSSPFSAFAVVKYANRSINTVIADLALNSNFAMQTYNQYTSSIGGATPVASGAFYGLNSDVRVLLEVTYDPTLASGSRVTLYTNGNSRATGGTATATTYTNQLLLNNTTPQVNGSSGLYYHELIILPSGTTASRRQQIEGYLTWKWGLQASLPTTHPYAISNYFYTNTRPFSRNFIPTDISNCIMWYDGADLRTMFTNTAGTTPVSGNGSLVRFWRDKSGSNNNLTSVSDGNSPTLTTSSNPQNFDIVFDGWDYLSNTALVNNSNTYTKFIVFRRTNNPATPSNNYQRLFSYGKTTGDQKNDDPAGFNLQTANAQTTYNIYKSFSGSGNITISSDTYHMISIIAGPTTISSFLDGSLTATNTFTPANTDFSATTFRLGTNFVVLANAGWPGFINEVISYNRQLQPYEVREVEGYLAWKWGLHTSLPTTHSYYKYPTPSLSLFQPALQLYNKKFTPSDLNPIIWFDPQDTTTVNVEASTNRILTIESKSDCTRTITNVPLTLLSVTTTTFTLSLTSGLVIASPIIPSNFVSGTPGLMSGTTYFVASISGNTVTLASSAANARSGIAITGFLSNGSLNVAATATISISPTFTMLSVSSNIFTISSQNGLTIGTRITPQAAVAGTPGLSTNTSYYISSITGNTIRLATTLANAFSATHMTGFTNNATLNAFIYYVFCLSTPPSISGPLLATSSINNGPSSKYMEFAHGGIFKVSGAVISGTTLTLTTEFPHNIPAGKQINLNVLSATYGENGASATAIAMGPFHVRYASLDTAGTKLTLVTSTSSGIVPTSNVYLNVNTATYNGGLGGSAATDLTTNYTVPANISVTATSSTSGTNVVTLSSVTGLAIGQGIQFTTAFGGIVANSTYYINTISGNNITISSSPFGTNQTLTTSPTGSGGTAGTFGLAIVLSLSTARTAGVIRVGDITIRNNAGLSGPYIVASSPAPTATTLAVTTYSTLTASTLAQLVARIEYGLLTFSSANLTSTTSMTIYTPIPHGLTNTDTFSSSFVTGIRPSSYATFTGATVNSTGTLLTIDTGISNAALFNTTGLACGLFLPSGTTFANGVQAGSILSTTATTQTGTNGTTQIVINISTTSANQGALLFVTNQPGKLILNPTNLIGDAGPFNNSLYTVSSSTTNSITFTVPLQTRSGIVTFWLQGGVINGYDGVMSNSPYNSYLNFPVNGYALENTSLGGALISREVTMIYVSHLLQGPLRGSSQGSNIQSPIISTSVSVNGAGGADTTSGGQDYRIQASLNAGTSRFQLKHNNIGVNNNPTYTNNIASSATVPSPFRVHSMVINTGNTNIGDIAAFTKCMAANGWRYSNVTSSSLTQTANITSSATVSTVTGIPSTAGFTLGSTVLKNTVLSSTGAFGTNSIITAINNNGTEITVTGSTSHTAGTIYFSVTPATSVLSTSSAAAVGNIATTSYLRPTHLRIGGDTAATTSYGTYPLCGYWYEGGIGDIIIFNSVLPIEQRQLVEGFLAQKYHTASTLGGTSVVFNTSFVHPYRLNENTISPSLILTQTYAGGLATWFDAANSSTIGFSSGNFVNSWTSAGGSIPQLTMTQATSANQPTLDQNVQNGLPGIKFIRGTASGGFFPNSSNLTTPTSSNINQFTTIGSNNEFTNFAVIKFTVDPANGHTVILIVSSNDRPYLLKGNLVQYVAGYYQEVVYSPALLVNTPYIITTIRRGSTGTTVIVGNGARNITTTSFGENVKITGASTRVTMGGYGQVPANNNDAFEGYVHEFVAFRYALTDQAIFQVEGYLAWKWGLNASLPTTHPYYKIRP